MDDVDGEEPLRSVTPSAIQATYLFVCMSSKIQLVTTAIKKSQHTDNTNETSQYVTYKDESTV